MRFTRFLFSLAVVGAAAAAASMLQAQEGPMTLDDAIHLALAKNQVIKVESYVRPIARANLLEAMGSFDPSINFSRSYSENRNPVSSSPFVGQLTQIDNYALSLDGVTPWGLTYSVGGTATNERGTFNSFLDSYATYGGVKVTQPLLRGFGFGANLAGVRIARADKKISEWDYRRVVMDTVTQVIYAYTEVMYARDTLRTALRSRELARGLVTENQKRFKVGGSAEADVTEAEARAAAREESILYAQRAVKDNENTLRQLIGEERFSTDAPPLNLAPLPTVVPITPHPAEDLRGAFDLRPDYQQALLGLTKFRVDESLARNQLLPRVDFVGSYGYAGLNQNFAAARAEVRDENNRAYSVGVVVSVPLTFSEGRGRFRSARLTLRQAEANLQRLESDIALNIANAAGQIETARLRVEANRHAYDLGLRNLDAEQKRLRAGTGSTFIVLQQQEILAAVETSYARSQADYRRAIAAYERELGQTLTKNQVTLAN